MNKKEKSILKCFQNIPYAQIDAELNLRKNKLVFRLESHNPAGSIKDKNAYFLIKKAEARGELQPGGTIIESSSGNLGIAFAVIGKKLGYHVHIVVDQKTSKTMKQLLSIYGAQVSEIPISLCDEAGSMQKARMDFAKKLQSKTTNSWYACQHLNPDTANVHYHLTAPFMDQDFKEAPDAIVIGVSTAGQLSGIASYYKQKYPLTQIIAVDVKGSAVFSAPRHNYKMTGLGLSFVPPAFSWKLLDHAYLVNDQMSFSACHYLANEHGLHLGASTGSGYCAALKWIANYNINNKTICIISSDGGDRYMDTLYDRQWLSQHDIKILNCEQIKNNMETVIECQRKISDISPRLS